MAVRADWGGRHPPNHRRPVNALLIDLLDLLVTLSAGLRDMDLGNGGIRIVRLTDRMRPVAIAADGRMKSLLRRLEVATLFVVLKGRRDVDMVPSDDLQVRVTFRAGIWKVFRMDR